MNEKIIFLTANSVIPTLSAMQAAGENSCRRTNITEIKTKFPLVSIPVRALSFLLFAFLILSVQPAFSAGLTEDFMLKKVGSHCEPEMDEWVAIPGRDMKAGSFVILYNKASDGTEEGRISGVLINNEAVYYPGGGKITGPLK